MQGYYSIYRFPRDFSPAPDSPPSIHNPVPSHLFLYVSLFLSVFLPLVFCPLLALTLVNRNHRCVRFLPRKSSALTMKNEQYCVRHMHAPFALSMPFFIPFIVVVRHEYPYANTRNSIRSSSTARESSIYLPPIIFLLLFISIYALASISRLREMLPDLSLSFLFFPSSSFLPLTFRSATKRGRTLITSSYSGESWILIPLLRVNVYPLVALQGKISYYLASCMYIRVHRKISIYLNASQFNKLF